MLVSAADMFAAVTKHLMAQCAARLGDTMQWQSPKEIKKITLAENAKR